MTDTAPRPSYVRAILGAAIVFALSTGFAALATMLLAMVANANNWCCVHSWALAHGTGLAVMLLFGLVGFHVVSFAGVRLGWLAPRPRYGWLPHLAYVLTALGTQSLTGFSYSFVWLGLLASAIAVAARLRGHKVHPFGLVVVAFVVSMLGVAYWALHQWSMMQYAVLILTPNTA